MHVYEVRPRKDHRRVDLISDVLPLGRLWYAQPDAVGNVPASFTYEKRRGRESNPRIAVLQTATLPLGYPADMRAHNIVVAALVSSADRR